MTKVGDPARVGWLEQPNCQACHFDGKRTTSAVDASGNLVKPADTRFATNPDTPALGMPVKFSLFRFSKGHGNLQCESCHGATHAEYPSTHANDNLQSIALQGYAGTIRECTVCHATTPGNVLNGGPHGMHLIGASWVSSHGEHGRDQRRRAMRVLPRQRLQGQPAGADQGAALVRHRGRHQVVQGRAERRLLRLPQRAQTRNASTFLRGPAARAAGPFCSSPKPRRADGAAAAPAVSRGRCVVPRD